MMVVTQKTNVNETTLAIIQIATRNRRCVRPNHAPLGQTFIRGYISHALQFGMKITVGNRGFHPVSIPGGTEACGMWCP